MCSLALDCCVVTSIDLYQDGATALIIAAEKGHHECLSILLAHGADINRTTGVSLLSGYPLSI